MPDFIPELQLFEAIADAGSSSAVARVGIVPWTTAQTRTRRYDFVRIVTAASNDESVVVTHRMVAE